MARIVYDSGKEYFRERYESLPDNDKDGLPRDEAEPTPPEVEMIDSEAHGVPWIKLPEPKPYRKHPPDPPRIPFYVILLALLLIALALVQAIRG